MNGRSHRLEHLPGNDTDESGRLRDSRHLGRATPSRCWGVWCRTRPVPVHEMAAPVTPGRWCSCSTVRDDHGCGRVSAAPRGDVSGPDDVAVTLVPAVRAGEATSRRFRNGSLALWAGGAGASLIYPDNANAGSLGLVDERADEVRATPRVEPPPLGATDAAPIDPAEVSQHQGPDSSAHGPRNGGLGCLVVRLVHPTAVTRLCLALGGAEPPPAPRSALASPGCLGRHLARPALRVGEVEALFGSDLAPRDQQRFVLCRKRERVDDSDVNTGDPVRIHVMVLDWDRRGHVHAESRRRRAA